MITMGPVTRGRAGAGIAWLPEIIDGLTKAICDAFRTVSLFELPPVLRDVESCPMMKYFGGRVRIVANEEEAARSLWDP